MYIDVHCHLTGGEYGDIAALIEKCRENGVKRLVTVGFDIPSSLAGKDLAERFDGVYFAAGFHPTELKKYREGDLKIIAELCSHPKCIALGEIGLDYHYPDTDKQFQRDIFLRQLEIAHEIKTPVQIHSRDCADDMLGILTENKDLLEYGALLHCYSHSTELSEEFERIGLYFSFGGASTWKGAKKAKRTIARLPLSRILTETDSPYMPPQSAYGTFPNTPCAIPEILKNIADIKGVPVEAAAGGISDNARRLFTKLR